MNDERLSPRHRDLTVQQWEAVLVLGLTSSPLVVSGSPLAVFIGQRFTGRLAVALLPTSLVTWGTFVTFLAPVFLSMKWE